MVSVNLLYAIHHFATLIQAQKTVSTFHRLLQFSEAFISFFPIPMQEWASDFYPMVFFGIWQHVRHPPGCNLSHFQTFSQNEMCRPMVYIQFMSYFGARIFSIIVQWFRYFFNIFTIRCRHRPSAQVLFAYIASPIIKFTYPPPDYWCWNNFFKSI